MMRQMTPPEPKFEAPWHASVFALTVHLNERGVFSWSDWTEVFGKSLAAHRLSHSLDGGDDYFLAWIDALENILKEKDIAARGDLFDLKQAWTSAYLSTPHGEPVKLANH